MEVEGLLLTATKKNCQVNERMQWNGARQAPWTQQELTFTLNTKTKPAFPPEDTQNSQFGAEHNTNSQK